MLTAMLVMTACSRIHSSESADSAEQDSHVHDFSAASTEALLAEFEEIALRYETGHSPFLGFGMLRQFELIANNDEYPEQERMKARLEMVRQLLKDGNEDRALEEIQRVDDWLAEADLQQAFSNPMDERYARSRILWVKALCWMRKAERENCVNRHNSDCCIFPLDGGGVHSVDRPALNAMQCYIDYLEIDPGNRGAIWLLNLSAMAADKWPDGLPEQYRLPEDAFSDDGGMSRFRDVAPQLGIDTFNLCGGTIVDDFSGDGLYDIVTSTYDFRGPLHYYVNDGKGKFEERSEESGLALQLGGLNCIGSDYDNDGDLDIFVLRGAWLMDDGLVRNSLLRNNGDGTFSDVTESCGMDLPGRPTQAACWHDFNNDGWLDLFVANESRTEIEEGGPSYPARLWVSNRDGSFRELAQQAGCANNAYGKGVTAGDYDNDGLVDIYVSNTGRNRLYRNRGELSFEDASRELDVMKPFGRSFVPWFFDYDNDGRLDLFVAAFDATIEDLEAAALGEETGCTMPMLYHNEGGSFRPVTFGSGLDLPLLPMGANFGDIDNDGWLDMYLATGDPEFESLMPNMLMHNNGDGSFEVATFSAGLGHLQKGHGVAFADIDNDGDQDIYHQLGGFYPGDKFANALFLNPGNANHWLKLRLEGVQTNRQGNGVRIRLLLDTASGSREIHRAAGSLSSFGGSPRTQEIGLGDATAIRELELYWPVSGTRQLFRDVPLDVLISVREDAGEWEEIQLTPISFE
ncbi:CRTAC1 family protein [bacterium]|nr:CRTAC1 family protein [bacterium]